MDLRAGELCDGQRTFRLQEQPFQILVMLIERDGQVVTRDEIRRKLWPNDTVVEFDHGINAAIKKLRQSLDDSADMPRYVETIARRGYRLVVRVERISKSDSSHSFDSNIVAETSNTTLQSGAVTADLIGKEVSHYRVLRIIGAGGMGVVYEAEDLKLGRRVALKSLPDDVVRDGVALQRFVREAKTASSLNHRNVCTIYEIEEHEHQPFIVMELLEGETLRERLAAAECKSLPLDELVEIAIQVCDGLQAAHDKGIIHRDIKPANVFLTNSGEVKILDFGVAKLARASEETTFYEQPRAGPAAAERLARPPNLETTLTRIGVAPGTAPYMSPEQIRGEALDARTDVFSFGLVLYEMAAGHPAFRGDSTANILCAILNDKPVQAGERHAGVLPNLQAIVDRAIEKSREQRYQRAADIRSELQQLKNDISSFARQRDVETVAGASRSEARFSAGDRHSRDRDERPRNDWVYFLLSALIFAATILVTAIFYDRLPSQIPRQWDFSGNVTGYSPKWAIFLIDPGIMAGFIIALPLLDRLSPKQFSIETSRGPYSYIMLASVSLVAYIHGVVLWTVIVGSIDGTRAVFGGAFLLMALLANVLPRLRPNFYLGIRTPWTLSNNQVWYATHTFGRKIFLVAGCGGLLLTIFHAQSGILLAMLVGGFVVPIPYSLVSYKRLERRLKS